MSPRTDVGGWRIRVRHPNTIMPVPGAGPVVAHPSAGNPSDMKCKTDDSPAAGHDRGHDLLNLV